MINLNKKKLFLFFSLLLASIWVYYFFNKDLFKIEKLFLNLDLINSFIEENFKLSFLIYVLSYFILIICNFPVASLLSLIGGFLFGTWIGGIGIVIGGSLGAFTTFLITKFFFLDYIKNKVLAKYTSITDYFNKNDLELMLLLRLIPGTPFFIQNLILAGLGANNTKFLFTTIAGLSPWAFIIASIGKALDEIYFSGEAISFSLIAKKDFLIPIITLILIIVLIILFKNKVKNKL